MTMMKAMLQRVNLNSKPSDKGPEKSLKERSRYSSFSKLVNNDSGIDPLNLFPNKRRSLRLDNLSMLCDKGPEKQIKMSEVGQLTNVRSKSIPTETEMSQHRKTLNSRPIGSFQVRIKSKVQEPYLLKISNLMRNNSTEIVVVKGEVLKLPQLPNLWRYASIKRIVAQVQEDQVGQITYGRRD
nr:hypothetical protein CCACVL1_30839 [Ipomoea batatas]